MGRFFRGLLIGAGIGMLIAPMRGEEMRRLISERYADLVNSLPDSWQLKQAGQQLASGVSQTANTVKDYTQQAASRVKNTGSDLSDLAQQAKQQASQQVKQTGQDA